MDTDFLRVVKTCPERYVLGVPISAFGQNVKRLRKAQLPPLKAKELAALIDTDPSVVSRWEQGKGGLPESPTLIRLATALHVSADQLLVGVNEAYDAVLLARADSSHEKNDDRMTSLVSPSEVQQEHRRAGGPDAVVVAVPNRLPQPETPLDAEVRALVEITRRLDVVTRLEQSAADIRSIAAAIRRTVKPAATGLASARRARSHSTLHRTTTRRGGRR